MSITVNEKTLFAVLTESQGKNEMIALLNEIIDEELEKEEMNTALVDECVQAIIDLESEGDIKALCTYQELVQYCHSEAFKKRIRLRRAVIIAAAAAILTSGALSVSPALAEQARSFIGSVIASLGIAAEESDEKNGEIVSIYAEPIGSINYTVKSEDEINAEAFRIFAVDKDNNEKEISVSKCKTTIKRPDGSHIMIIYSYEGCACSVIYNLEEV